ncbi:Gfo/Idh/MocA family protein [Phenylobacterium sp.]|uniref:Gfo/Idh/MocA family protein n=1 Tax=Phenylobacterium sp. TaxID=1871053 RepID=UPI002FC7E270
MAASRFKIAQLGAGRMGTVHARGAAANPRLRLAYLVDPRPEAAAPLAKEVGAKLADLDTVLADPEVVGVIVASSTDVHLDNTLACLRAGKAVFCEKPLDLDLARLQAAKAEITASAAPLLVAFNRRFDPHYLALKARIGAGAIGRLESLNIINHDPAPPAHAFIVPSGGLFKDFTIHDLDLACWLLEETPVELFAAASCLVDPVIGEKGDVDTARVVLKTASGQLCMISNTRRSGCGYDQRIEAFGSQGVAMADNPRLDTVQVWGEAGAVSSPIPRDFIGRYAQAYRAELDHFADVLAGAPSQIGFAESVRALTLAEAAAESVRSGRSVRL